jgi:hypothetical protein
MIIIAGAAAFACIAILGIIFAKRYVKLPQWLQFSLMLLVVAAMFVFVWYTHRAAQKQEAVFMGICWDSTGTAHYPVGGEGDANCDDPQSLDWKKRPKTVRWLLPAEFDDYRRSFEEALRFWNDALGDTVVVEIQDDAADVLLVQGSAGDSGAMSTSHQRAADGIKSTIRVNKPGNIRLFMLQLEHELGHALFGLAHDRGRSIMNPRAGEAEDEQMKVWFVTEKDKDAIRRTME